MVAGRGGARLVLSTAGRLWYTEGVSASPSPSALDLLDFIAASPTPEHCAVEVARRLELAGFRSLDEGARWSLAAGEGVYVRRQGSVVALRIGQAPAAEAGFRLLGAHTDSPNLRLKPSPDLRGHGLLQLGVEAYGGLLEYTWLDRDLGLAGPVFVREADGSIGSRLVHITRPIVRVVSLAIHLQRDLRETGLKLNRQTHLAPILGIDPGGEADPGGALRWLLAGELGCEPRSIVSWDLSLCDLARPCLWGRAEELIAAPRLDNQAMCHAALSALLQAGASSATQVICLYDHEEVGSGSATGAESSAVEALLRRVAELEGPGACAGGLPRALARSRTISADMAHAVHPNFSDKHDPQHQPRLGYGPVIKFNVQQRYATTAEDAAIFAGLCEAEGVGFQRFVSRGDMTCGTTIGPISAARLGVRTLDVGSPMLAMHSIREVAAAADVAPMIAVMRRFLATPRLA
ncbi:MAG: M18 family aminopeptidase [Nannocystis sp.]|nr:M18 family aminopeptidase [Nannocystis sp.]